MILIARKTYHIKIEQKYFKQGEVFKGWFDGDVTIFLENKRVKFTCHRLILRQYFRIWGDVGEIG